MQRAHFNRLKTWFVDYTRGFLTGDASQDAPLVLKIGHTDRVCANMRWLADELDLPAGDRWIAAAIGLLHDLGRFEQFRQYRTFDDRRSVNHAALGVDVLIRTGMLQDLPDREARLIIDAVRLHNAPRLPSHRSPAGTRFMRMIRDADKLDIWKVFADIYHDGRPLDPAIVQHLPDQPTWSPAVVAAIDQRRTARVKDMLTLNDFKLLQLSWVFDLNFAASIAEAGRRDDLATIAASLPADPVVQRAVAVVMHHVSFPSAPPDRR